jgi:membrane-bound metal-dependent hydrolase YbcI (DUF457 family)
MPNTLAHLGAQALVSRRIIPEAEHKWIYLGCLIPDLPWIAQRSLRVLVPSIDLYDLRLYAIAQSSLAVSLLLAGAFAAISRAPRRILAILALNSTLHLLLDALQTKWGSGVHLFAPFSWRLWNLGLFWPESVPTYALTGLGLVYVLWTARRPSPRATGFAFRSAPRIALAGSLLILYLVLPLALAPAVERSDSHFVQTLRNGEARAGREVEFDRDLYTYHEQRAVLRTFAGERLKVRGSDLQQTARVSVRAVFVDANTVRLYELHLHRVLIRDLASFLGLALVASVWGVSLLHPSHRRGLSREISE